MKYLKSKFKTLDPYKVSEVKQGIYLNANEAFYKTPQNVLDYASKCISFGFNRYPDNDCKKLIDAISRRYNVSKENICCGVGSDELIEILTKATVSDKIVLSVEPTFSMYNIFSFMNDGEYVSVPLNEDFSFNVDLIIEKIKEINPILTFICNPNNPSGSIMEKSDILRILDASEGIVVVDEAYEDFANNSVIEYVNNYDNLVVLRTFSKAYALAGIRCGYMIASKNIIDIMNMVRPPYTLNSFSIDVASYALNNYLVYKPLIEETIENREYLYEEIKKLNIEVYPSKANFLYLYLTDEQRKKLEKNNIFIRYFKKYSRVSVGSKLENEAFLDALRG